MKKKYLLLVSGLVSLTLVTGCTSSNKRSNAESTKTSKVKKRAKYLKKKKVNKKKASKKKQATLKEKKQPVKSTQTNTQQQDDSQNQQQVQQTTQQPQQKTQSQINMERGYDPNGAPLLPGQDHAAGSDVYGNPDPWVQGQINWAIRNGYMNPDGTDTEKGKQLEQQLESDDYDIDDEDYEGDY